MNLTVVISGLSSYPACKADFVDVPQSHQDDGVQKLHLKWPVSKGQALYLVQVLRKYPAYRIVFSSNLQAYFSSNESHCNHAQITLTKLYVVVDESAHCIDRMWNRRLLYQIRLKMELWESMAWMSTLGGAYSCLGEHDTYFASKAGAMSKTQMQLSSVVGDPNLVVRCAIYKVYSFCQLNQRKKARSFLKDHIFPFLSQMIFNKCCDNIVKNMYRAACHKVKYHQAISFKG